jgi:flagellar biosynthesis/type III secretory pathway chaperone
VPPLSRRAQTAPESDCTAVEQLIRSLQAEGEALIGGDIDKLNEAVRDKERFMQRLAAGFGSLDRAELQRAVRRARDLNDRNARLLAAHMNLNRSRIQALLGPARTGMLYSSDGRAAGAEQRPARRGVRA